mgnify:CR=1 FL=1
MKFRPCIDIHNGTVKQIVGGSLLDEQNQAEENFVSEKDAAWFAEMYAKKGLKGGHIILLNPPVSEFYEATKKQAVSALGRPVGTGNENEETFCSYRVEEPFLWILSRWGWIDAEDDKFGNLFRKAVALLRRWRKL